jgi:hypothetical protein
LSSSRYGRNRGRLAEDFANKLSVRCCNDSPLRPDKDKSENFPGSKEEITQQKKSEEPRQLIGLFSHCFAPFAEPVY